MSQELTQEERDIIIEDARYGDLETLHEIFAELDASLLLSIKEEVTLVTTIHMAAANGHEEVVSYLSSLLSEDDAKTLINSQNESGNTALHWASLNGHLSTVEALVKFGADPFIKNSSGHDAIYEAEHNNKEDVAEWYLSKYSIEDDYNLKDQDAVKISYKPGEEILEAQKEAKQVEEELEKKTRDLEI